MLLLTSVSDIVRLVTSSAASTIEVHTSYMDVNGTTITPGRTNTRITTATTTTIVASPAASTYRNVKAIYCTNNSAGTSCVVSVEHFDGTNSIELMSFTLLPGENLGYREDGSWVHRDRAGAEYPPAGLGEYNGRSIPFMKSGTASDAVGYWYCTAKDAGYPGAWVPGTPGINGRVTDGTVAADFGCIPIENAATGSNYLTELLIATSTAHANVFFDVLWVNSGLVVTTTTAQAIVTPTLPARDVNGGTIGEGCGIALYFSAASTMAAVATNWTVTYTNSAGVAGRTATLTAVVGSQAPATPVVGTIVFFNLAAGDIGVKSIEAWTAPTSLLTGTIHLMITRDLAMIGTTIVNIPAARAIAPPGVRLFNGTCMLHCVMSSATTATFFNGEVTVMER
jgi:hypothetical protein